MQSVSTHIETIVGAFFARAATDPERTAFIHDGIRISWKEAASIIAATAEGFHSSGMRKGDRIILWGGNHPELAMTYLAAHAAGLIVSPVDGRTPREEILWRLNEINARLIVRTALPKGISELEIDSISAGEILSRGQGALPRIEAHESDIGDILFTTGSIDRPKGVMLSHANIMSAARNINAVIGQDSEDVELVTVPLSHSFGLGRLRCMTLAGNALIFDPDLRDVAGTVLRLLQSRATGLAMVPAGFELMRKLTRDSIGRAASHLRYIEIGSAPISAETRQWLMEILPNTRIYHHFGMTEVSRALFTEYHRDTAFPGTIGRPSPNVIATVVDAEGNEVPDGTEGELAFRGKVVMTGYWGEAIHPAGTHFRSGDLGYRDSNGYFYLRGRLKDVVNVAGLKVMPGEIESALAGYPGVIDCGCVGIPDPAGLSGETVALGIVKNSELNPKALRLFLLQRLESFKVPTVVVALSLIPRASNGKLLRAELRGMIEEMARRGS